MGARVHLKQVWEPNFHLLPWLRDSPKPTEPCLWPPAANSMHPALAYSSPHQCIDCQELTMRFGSKLRNNMVQIAPF